MMGRGLETWESEIINLACEATGDCGLFARPAVVKVLLGLFDTPSRDADTIRAKNALGVMLLTTGGGREGLEVFRKNPRLRNDYGDCAEQVAQFAERIRQMEAPDVQKPKDGSPSAFKNI